MKGALSLDDLELFACVGQAGGLTSVARQRGVSVPTLSRRMRALEAQTGQKLFERGPYGYRLTAQGRAFLDETRVLQDEARRLRGLVSTSTLAEVRITAGSWTSAFLAQNVSRFWNVRDTWRPVFLEANARIDIARRGADIGIRNERPTQPWLAGRSTGRIDYAVYARDAQVKGFITVPEGAEGTPSLRWVREHHGDEICVQASNARIMADLACGGVGRVVLPKFAAEGLPLLQQIGPPIAELSHEEWLVCHHDARHDSSVRAALEALACVLTDTNLRPSADVPQQG